MPDLRLFANASNLVRFTLKNSSTGVGLTGLSSSSAGLIISTIADVEATATAYTQAGSTIESITTLGTFAAPTATKCRFKEVDATNHAGLYEFQIADARFAVTNARRLIISVSGATNLLNADYEIELVQFNPFDAQRLGLTSLPASSTLAVKPAVTLAAADVSGNLPVDVQTVKTQTVTCAAGITVGAFVGNATAALAVDASGRVDLGKILGTASAGAVGYVGIDWSHINAPTTTVALSGTTVGTLTTYTGNTVQTGDSYARIGAPAGASIAADLAEIEGETDTLLTNVAAIPTNPYIGTPPTTAQIVTAIFTDLMAGTDFNTAGSFGALVKADLDTNIGSRSTYAGGDTSGTTTLLTRVPGVIQPQTGDSYARIGAAGAGLTSLAPASTALSTVNWTNGRATNLDNLDAAVSTRMATFVYTAPDNTSITTILGQTSTTGVVVASASKTGYALSATGVDLIMVAGKTLPNAVRYIGATATGAINGAGTGTETFKDFAGVTAVTVTVDPSGNRTSVVYA